MSATGGGAIASHAHAMVPISIGDVVAGKYRLESLIGEGGMGAVYAAHHELLDVSVAVKVLSPQWVHNSSAVDRFLREARAVARLRSEHVARVMDVGTLEGGQPYIVMELLEGEDLRERLGRGPLPVEEAVDCVLQALEAMAHAHPAGIIHRDLKPENLFVAAAPDGREVVKVLDFGIAKLTERAGTANGQRAGALTGEHATLGSPHYMSPEQVRDSSQLDHRTDIWAAGAVLYELVTGREAFQGASVAEILAAVLHSTPAPLRTLCTHAPAELEAVVARCLTREADGRFADVAELARALAPLGSGVLSAYVERIEQTLACAEQRLSDPASGPVSVRATRARPAIDLSGGARAPSPSRACASAPQVASVSEVRGERGAGRFARRLSSVLLATTIAALAALGIARLRSSGRAGVPGAASEPASAAAAGSPSSAPATPPSTAIPPLPLPPSPPAVSSGRPPVRAGHRDRPAAASPAVAPKRPAASPLPHLPGVLASPE
jgi:serine/threonine-protein kinase